MMQQISSGSNSQAEVGEFGGWQRLQDAHSLECGTEQGMFADTIGIFHLQQNKR